MSPDDAEEYTQALGQVVAGGWRQVALGERLGVPAALGLSTREWVEQRLGGYVRLAIPERREAVAELTAEGMSTREIGAVLGVDQSTVVRDVSASREPEPEPERQVAEPPEPTPDADASAAPAWTREAVADAIGLDDIAAETQSTVDEALDGTGLAAEVVVEWPDDTTPAPGPTADPVGEWVGSSQSVQDASYMHEFLKAVSRSNSFMQFDAERVGRLADRAQLDVIEDLPGRVERWVAAATKAGNGLRVVKGGSP